MDCKRIQELLPLYVGCDLSGKLAKSIGVHLQSCKPCANSADEYRETRQLLRQFEPPAWDHKFYSSLRQEALRQVSLESNASGRIHVFAAGRFRPNLRWALVTVLLLVGCLLTLYVSSIRRAENPQLATNSRSGKRTIANPLTDAQSAGERPDKSLDRSPAISTRKKVFQAVSNVVKKGSERLATVNEGIHPEPNQSAGGDPYSSKKIMRMEIQTKDQNIRIIWFSYQNDKEGSSTESKQGT
jgi:hypothetical protein